MESMKHLLKDPQREKPGPQLAPEHRQPSPLPSPTAVWGQPGVQSSSQQRLQTQDWVCEPPRRSRRPSRHWSLSIEERRRWAMLGIWQRRGAAGGSAHCLDVAQIVAQLVSQDVDKDVLIPHPRRSFESNHAFHAFLAQSVPSWQNSTLEAQVSSWPPS
ncbi:testis-expressed protein 22 [Rhinolophus ferrumequinum]|uniref:Testis expressed 22 n=1 Tax=Rhinolophus ferrumequinum TaxID=59479 RepID=A0A671DL58_RHIFE|nr:testis-expressed protein 22 [Rhinolophus ferrumequinum]